MQQGHCLERFHGVIKGKHRVAIAMRDLKVLFLHVRVLYQFEIVCAVVSMQMLTNRVLCKKVHLLVGFVI